MGAYKRAKRPLDAEADIIQLDQKTGGRATEDDFKNVLRRYNLRKGLIILGRTSNDIFHVHDQNKIGRVAYREPTTGVIITQFALAYIANILLISGSNDYKRKSIGKMDNLLTLCNSYDNCLIDPALTKDDKTSNEDKYRSLIIRMNFQQMEYQFAHIYMMARTIVMFNELIEKVKPDKFKPLPEVFQEETGLSIHDYLYLSTAITVGSKETATFSTATLCKANISQLSSVLTEEKMSKFLNILKADYTKFRNEDARANEGLRPIHTKSRFNPLMVYPILETDANGPYIIPNVVLHIRRSFEGLYW